MSTGPGTDESMAGSSVLVAGATGGLGSAIAADLERRGAELTLVARSEERLAGLAVSGHRLALDLRDPDSCDAAVREAMSRTGRLDAVVNAVGVTAFGPIDELSIDTLEELFVTNTFIPVLLARAALPALGDGGVLVNISGVISEANVSGMAAYGASKAAVRSFDQALGREARRRKLRVIDARPPHTETGLAERPIAGIAPKLKQGLDPADVAAVICRAIADGTNDLPRLCVLPVTVPAAGTSAHHAPAGFVVRHVTRSWTISLG